MSLQTYSPHLMQGNGGISPYNKSKTSPAVVIASNSVDGTSYSPAYGSSPRSDYKPRKHLYVLPVLLLEFLALALTRAVLPALLLDKFGNNVYLVMGCADCIRGLLAFVACPLFGKISDIVGRRLCLFVTVMGTCAPVCSLALFSWGPVSSEDGESFNVTQAASTGASEPDDSAAAVMPMFMPSSGQSLHPSAVTVFVVLLALSGIFSSTFTLVFAYISDTVKQRDGRVSAYGLALATFGLSFTIGPMAGGYVARYNTHYVFLGSFFLTILDLLYIYFILPESRDVGAGVEMSSTVSFVAEHNLSWSPWDTMRVIAVDPFLRRVGQVAFLYYTGLWAVISTLSVYAVKRFHLGPERLGELMSALGLCTMLAEAVLVRLMVPLLGEKRSMKVGLFSFGLQCVVLGFAFESWHLFVCAAFSLLGNLVYPSLSSLVSESVEPEAVGEALGAVNGVKALTEGIGPLVFGSLMTLSEHSALPGWPYLLAAVLIAMAYKFADQLPEGEHYIHELEKKHRGGEILLQRFAAQASADEEYQGLLSEVDEDDSDNPWPCDSAEELPATFASLMKDPSPG